MICANLNLLILRLWQFDERDQNRTAFPNARRNLLREIRFVDCPSLSYLYAQMSQADISDGPSYHQSLERLPQIGDLSAQKSSCRIARKSRSGLLLGRTTLLDQLEEASSVGIVELTSAAAS